MNHFAEYVPADVVRSSDAAAKGLIHGLELRYAEPWRHYHTGQHIADLLGALRLHGAHVEDPRVVGWAMLYHDAVYDPTSASGRNEELSAQLAEHEACDLLLPQETQRVAAYVRATASHQAGNLGSEPDLNFFLDTDLMILGSSEARYQEYARQIRQEYAHVPAEDYWHGRVKVLESLVEGSDSGDLFKTELFRDLYEDQAQKNIAREMKQLVDGKVV